MINEKSPHSGDMLGAYRMSLVLKKAYQLWPTASADILFWRTRLMRYTPSISPECGDFSYTLTPLIFLSCEMV